MLTEEKIRKILYERYTVRIGTVLNSEEFIKCFKLYHKMLSGEVNVNHKGFSILASRYIRMRDKSAKKTKALSECVQLL